MPNPILQMLTAQPQNHPTNNPLQLIRQFQEFSKSMTPQKAEQIIKQKLQNGEISQQQFESLKSQAIEMSKMLGIK